MDQKLDNYLRTFRRRAGFTQEEVAFLLGRGSGTKVSRHEGGGRGPGLRTVLAYQAIFAVGPEQLFAGTYDRIEHEVRRRAGLLAEKLEARELSAVMRHKLASLRAIARENHTLPPTNRT
jgi:transcriptional regulator with XRE-family HTH domain